MIHRSRKEVRVKADRAILRPVKNERDDQALSPTRYMGTALFPSIPPGPRIDPFGFTWKEMACRDGWKGNLPW